LEEGIRSDSCRIFGDHFKKHLKYVSYIYDFDGKEKRTINITSGLSHSEDSLNG
jgi:hypothetical protein